MTFLQRFVYTIFLFGTLLLGHPAVAVESTVYLYTYHNKPPFITDLESQTGLYYDLADYLNQQTLPYNFKTEYLPRKRLDLMLANGSIGLSLIIGVNPLWFDDVNQKRYLWFENIYQDRDEFVSLKSSAFDYTGMSSLTGKIVAGVAGHYYFGINEAVLKRSVYRIDTIGELQVLELVEMGRADVGIVSQSVFEYLHSVKQLPDVFHLSKTPHDTYHRRAFTMPNNIELYRQIQPYIDSLSTDPEWQKIVDQYR